MSNHIMHSIRTRQIFARLKVKIIQFVTKAIFHCKFVSKLAKISQINRPRRDLSTALMRLSPSSLNLTLRILERKIIIIKRHFLSFVFEITHSNRMNYFVKWTCAGNISGSSYPLIAEKRSIEKLFPDIYLSYPTMFRQSFDLLCRVTRRLSITIWHSCKKERRRREV